MAIGGLVAAVVLASTVGPAASALHPAALPDRWVLEAGEALTLGQALVSPNGRTKLRFDHDGDLVLYRDGAVHVVVRYQRNRSRQGGHAGRRRTGALRAGRLRPPACLEVEQRRIPGAVLSVRDDGGVVVRREDTPILWSAALPAPDVGLSGVRHIVYGRGDQMVWLVDADGTLFDSYSVSGRATYPRPGRYKVFSKSRYTQSRTGTVFMEYMVRFVKRLPARSVGFHTIPVTRSGRPVQTVDELGQFRSAGCVRQRTDKAEQLYHWTPVGTPVVVLA